ncbi:MAG TPA: 50S ribosomal protein L30 [bacterium]|nr:50S ribosomal protein L30 [bacterium]
MAERVKIVPPTLPEGAELARVRVTLRKSLIGRPADQRRTAHALGLRRIGASRIHAQTSSLTGAVRKIQHLVSVEEVEHGRAG